MVKKMLRLIPIFCLFALHATAQGSFVQIQKSISRPGGAFQRFEDSLEKQFEKKQLTWPPQNVYLRSFKYDKQLEVWVRANATDPYKLLKTYKVCMASGTIGPKRHEGDFQVPEGIYHINEFNPNSNYHLSLGLNYPNASDKILSDEKKPGNAIYIHGSCVSTGCIPIADMPIEELYVLTAYAKDAGQEFIPVHVFPVKFDVKKSADYLNEAVKNDPTLLSFTNALKEVFNYFETKKQLPIITVDSEGQYEVQ
jgi:murein L,D-transpeptidase YafK